MVELITGNSLIQHPWFIPLALVIGTYVLEDAAIVSGAILVSEGLISMELAFIALLIGIVSGDLMLYASGYFSRRVRFLRTLHDTRRMISVGRWLSTHLFFTILLVRFAPGLRLPCYLACGWFSVSVKAFILSVSIAGCMWMLLVFGGLLWLGEPLWESSFVVVLLDRVGLGKWVLLPLLVAVLYGTQWFLKSIIRNYLEVKDDQEQR